MVRAVDARDIASENTGKRSLFFVLLQFAAWFLGGVSLVYFHLQMFFFWFWLVSVGHGRGNKAVSASNSRGAAEPILVALRGATPQRGAGLAQGARSPSPGLGSRAEVASAEGT